MEKIKDLLYLLVFFKNRPAYYYITYTEGQEIKSCTIESCQGGVSIVDFCTRFAYNNKKIAHVIGIIRLSKFEKMKMDYFFHSKD